MAETQYVSDEAQNDFEAQRLARSLRMEAAVNQHIAEAETANGGPIERSFRFPVSNTTPPHWSSLLVRDEMPLTELRDNIERILKHSPDAHTGSMFTWLYAASHNLEY